LCCHLVEVERLRIVGGGEFLDRRGVTSRRQIG
jgi:hypothetical protein